MTEDLSSHSMEHSHFRFEFDHDKRLGRFAHLESLCNTHSFYDHIYILYVSRPSLAAVRPQTRLTQTRAKNCINEVIPYQFGDQTHAYVRTPSVIRRLVSHIWRAMTNFSLI